MNLIKILILTANPKIPNYEPLRLDAEVREIEEALRRSVHRDHFQLKTQLATRTADLRRALLDHEPQIVHFSGHGSGENGLVLENDAGTAQQVSTEALEHLFAASEYPNVECVLLNACYSEIQAKAIHQKVDCVIGMNQPIGDKAAVQFAIGFYDALGAGRSYEEAYNYGRSAISAAGISECKIPVLMNRKRRNVPLSLVTSRKQSKRLELTVDANIDEIKPLLEVIVAHLQKLSGDVTLTLTSIERGSVKLIFDGSDEGFAQIEALVKSGQLTELYGFAVQNVHYVLKKKRPRTSGAGGDEWTSNPPGFYSRDSEAAYHEPRQSQSFGDITISGSNNPFNSIQSTGDVTLSQNLSQGDRGNTDLQAALEALMKLKQEISATDALGRLAKEEAESRVEMVQKELQKPKPDKSFIDEVVEALKKGLAGVVTLATPMTQVAELIAKAYMGL